MYHHYIYELSSASKIFDQQLLFFIFLFFFLLKLMIMKVQQTTFSPDVYPEIFFYFFLNWAFIMKWVGKHSGKNS